MRFITDKKENEKFEAIKESIIDQAKEIPENVFKEKYKHFLFLNFDWIYERKFFNSLIDFILLFQEKKFFLSALKKEVEENFYKETDKYPSLVIENLNTYDEFNKIIYNIPYEDSTMAFGYYPDEILYFSENQKWAVYGCRDWEIAICGFETEILRNQFKSLFKEMLLQNVVEASEFAMQLDKHEELRKIFQKNYG